VSLRQCADVAHGGDAMRILLADDHPLYADALRTLVERTIPAADLTVVGDLQAADRALAATGPYDLAILDLQMPGGSGTAGIERLLSRYPETPLVVISGAAAAGEISRLIRLGVRGFLPKSLPNKVVAAALQLVLSGGTYMPPDYAQAMRPVPPPGGGVGGLTPRETEVLALLAAGRSNKEIGRALALQEITVKLHVRNIFRKLHVRNRVQAANAATRLDLADAPRR
jgi:two-component system, NarL family, nitrate/nitrite response regulator NarL